MNSIKIFITLIVSISFSQKPQINHDSSRTEQINELITERHPNGLKKLVLVFKGTGLNETLVGKYGFYSNGFKEFQETYRDNLKDGKCIYWHENGNKQEVLTFQNGLMSGTRTVWREDGVKTMEGKYVNGLMEGEWFFYFRDKESEKWKSLKGSYKSGDGSDLAQSSDIPKNGRHGLFTIHDNNGVKLDEFNYSNGILDGSFTQWYENGQMMAKYHYKKGILDGLGIQWYENGNKKQESTYKNGKVDGLAVAWHQNGQKHFKMNFINGIKNGKYEKWDENGIKRKEWYLNNDGSRDSTKMTILWYDNGQIWSQGYYKTVDTTNLKIGFHESWYKEGNKYF